MFGRGNIYKSEGAFLNYHGFFRNWWGDDATLRLFFTSSLFFLSEMSQWSDISAELPSINYASSITKNDRLCQKNGEGKWWRLTGWKMHPYKRHMYATYLLLHDNTPNLPICLCMWRSKLWVAAMQLIELKVYNHMHKNESHNAGNVIETFHTEFRSCTCKFKVMD